MILSFNTKRLNGEPTYFPEKIWTGILLSDDYSSTDYIKYAKHVRFSGYHFNIVKVGFSKPKIHTIREDKHNRWKLGMLIHFIIFNRTARRVQFAPILQCKSVQRIEIFPNKLVFIDGKRLSDSEIENLAINDGFSSSTDFFRVFNYLYIYTGKIIHWTDLKY